jgi:hypothetical protein
MLNDPGGTIFARWHSWFDLGVLNDERFYGPGKKMTWVEKVKRGRGAGWICLLKVASG